MSSAPKPRSSTKLENTLRRWRAAAVAEHQFGPDHLAMAPLLEDIARLRYRLGQYAEAEAPYRRALAIRERALGGEHPDVAATLNDLAVLLHVQGRYDDVEPLLKRALAIREKALGPEHPDVGTTLNNLGVLYASQGRYAEAEHFSQRALAVREKALGPQHAGVGEALNNLAMLLEGQRHRLFDAVSRAIAAGDRPRLLIIDDLQWCDAETIELIGFVVRSGHSAPVLIVGTVRWEEIPQQHPLVELVDALGHDRAVTTVALERLDAAATATLAARLRGEATIDPGLAARLWSETEGNPLFVIEALRAGISSDGSQAVLSPTMRAVLRARLGQLTDGARRLAEVAAVIGRPFSVGLMASAAGTDERELVDHVDELWHRRIIREQGLTYDFSHDKLRAVALEMVSPARRRQLHRTVAEAIAVERRKDIDAASPQLAAHYDQASLVEPAIDAYRVAGS